VRCRSGTSIEDRAFKSVVSPQPGLEVAKPLKVEYQLEGEPKRFALVPATATVADPRRAFADNAEVELESLWDGEVLLEKGALAILW
jgi:hypothetical protein